MCTNHSTTDTSIDPNNAATNPATRNPVTKYAAAQNRSAFNTIPNNPRVMILIGSVSNVKIGLIIKLINPRTSPATKATCHETTEIPGIKYAARITVAESRSHLMMSLMINIDLFPFPLGRG